MYIGRFTAARDGFAGVLQTLTIDRKLAIVPAIASEAENAPDYRILTGDGEAAREIGAGWKQTGNKAGDYLAVQIEDPALPRPLRANLFDAGDGHHVLSWVRPSRARRKD